MWTFIEISFWKWKENPPIWELWESVMFFNSALDRRTIQTLVSSAAEKCRTGQRSRCSETSWRPFLGNDPDLFWWLIFRPVKFFGLRPSCCCGNENGSVRFLIHWCNKHLPFKNYSSNNTNLHSLRVHCY